MNRMTGVDMADINLYNEVRVHIKFSTIGGHENIIPILKHGWVEKNRTYFFDMERCPMTLESFICYEFKSILGLSRYFTRSSGNLAILNFPVIVEQITKGLKFIHDMGEIYRDLKPSNGKSLGDSERSNTSSTS